MRIWILLVFSVILYAKPPLPTWLIGNGSAEVNKYQVKKPQDLGVYICQISTFYLDSSLNSLKWVKTPYRNLGLFIQQNFQLYNQNSPLYHESFQSVFRYKSDWRLVAEHSFSGNSFGSFSYYLDIQNHPFLSINSSKAGLQEYTWLKADINTKQSLFQLVRLLAWKKTTILPIHILHNQNENSKLFWSEIQITDDLIPLSKSKDIVSKRIIVKHQNNKVSEFYVSQEGSFRIIKAILWNGEEYNLISSTREKIFK
jgi:hypothetical protein